MSLSRFCKIATDCRNGLTFSRFCNQLQIAFATTIPRRSSRSMQRPPRPRTASCASTRSTSFSAATSRAPSPAPARAIRSPPAWRGADPRIAPPALTTKTRARNNRAQRGGARRRERAGTRPARSRREGESRLTGGRRRSGEFERGGKSFQEPGTDSVEIVLDEIRDALA